MDVDRFKPYTPGDYPSIKGGEAAFISTELEKIKQSLKLTLEVMTALEARIVALEP